MYLSASKIATLNKCSWSFYAKYILKLPDESNDGARRGSVTHEVLEFLAQPENHDLAREVLASKDPESFDVIKDMVEEEAKKQELVGRENLDMVYTFILNALKFDFFLEGYDIVGIERKFVLEEDGYKALGFIDVDAERDDESLVKDYKTSKAKKSPKELAFDVQAYMYALASYKRDPNKSRYRVQFQFLKFVRTPNQFVEFTPNQLLGFEEYLKQVYEHISDYNVSKAVGNLASNSKSNYWLCGKKQGMKKKDGSPAWICPFKYPYIYYEAQDADGKIVKTSKKKSDLQELSEVTIVTKYYDGCPAWKGKL